MSNTRTAEKLIALLRYEIGPDSGAPLFEIVSDLLATAGELIGGGGAENDDELSENMPRYEKAARDVADHIVMALVANGFAAEVETLINDIAASRRRCEAKFHAKTLVPLSDEERERLAKEWDESDRAARAEVQ